MSKVQCEELRKQVSDGNSALSRVQAQREQAEHKSEEFRQYDQVHSQVTGVFSQLSTARQQASNMESMLSGLQSTHRALSSENSALQQQQSESRQQLQTQQIVFRDMMSILGTYSQAKGIKLNANTLLTEILPPEGIEQSKILQDACAAQCITDFDAALAKITNINFQDSEGKTILMHSIINGFYYGVDKLLQMGANVNLVDKQGANALIYSAGLPHIKYTKLIAELTDDINLNVHSSENNGGNALHRLVLDANKTVFASELNRELRGTIKQNSILVLDEDYVLTSGWSGRILGKCSMGIVLTGEGIDLGGLTIIGSEIAPVTNRIKALELVRFLVDKNINIDAQDQRGQTPLLFSVGLKLFDVMNLLVTCDAKDIPSHVGTTALWVSAANGDLESVRILADLGGLNILCNGLSPLYAAMSNKHMLVAEELLTRGADVNIKGQNGWIALHFAAYFNEANTAQTILTKGTNINAQNNDGATPLLVAVYNNGSLVTKLLIDNGADANIPNNNGIFPWHFASSNGFLDIMKILAPKIPTIDQQTTDADQYTALWLASEQGHLETVKWLIANNADVDAVRASDGRTALQAAIWGKKLPVVQELVERGANVNKKDHQQFTPIYNAVNTEDLKTIKFLLEHGANSNLVGSSGDDKPIHLASFLCNVIIMKILLERGASVDDTNNSGNTPLHEVLLEENTAESSKKVAAVKYLLAKEAKVDIKNAKEEAPLDLADHHFKEALPWLAHRETLPPLAELEISLIGDFSYAEI